MKASARSNVACSIGPAGKLLAMRIGNGCQGPVASIALTKAAASMGIAGVAERASFRISSPSSQQTDRKSSSLAGRDHRLDSSASPISATRGFGIAGSGASSFRHLALDGDQRWRFTSLAVQSMPTAITRAETVPSAKRYRRRRHGRRMVLLGVPSPCERNAVAGLLQFAAVGMALKNNTPGYEPT